jgi:hypothetical protein
MKWEIPLRGKKAVMDVQIGIDIKTGEACQYVLRFRMPS